MPPSVPLGNAVHGATPPGDAGKAHGLDPKRAREAAQEFEAVFLSQMGSHMFSGLATDGPFGGGPSEQTYRAMLYQEFGKVLAKAGGVGIADAVMREMLKIQEGQTR